MNGFNAGRYINRGSYQSFEPTEINQNWVIDDMNVISLLSKADRQLGRLDMYSECIPNIDWFIHIHVTKEATKSSEIEGTQTNIEEALLDETEIPDEKRDDWREVQNYTKAMNESVKALDKLPISSRLIKQAHSILLSGARGEHKQPGKFRTSQNWIGGASISDAVFIPPHHSGISALMGDLEKFLHNESIAMPPILKIALMHYQFETIHPFLDGNGRIGRLLITLYFVEKQILKKPILYLSDFFEKHRSVYYDKLTRVRTHHDITGWFLFFLEGIIQVAEDGIKTFDRLLKLQESVQERIQTLEARSVNAQLIVKALYQRPFITALEVSRIAKITKPTAYKLVDDLEKLGILKEYTGAKRGRLYGFQEYVRLFMSNR